MTHKEFLKQIVLSDASYELREFALAQLLLMQTAPVMNDAVGIRIPVSSLSGRTVESTKYITRNAYTEIGELIPTRKIEAIKLLRDAVGTCSTGYILGLGDAKNAVEHWNYKL